MSNIDYSRKKDLEDIANAIKKAKSHFERRHYEKIMHRIIGESENVRYWREELIKAIDSGADHRKFYCIDRIQRIKQEETNGKSWGSDKGNKYVN